MWENIIVHPPPWVTSFLPQQEVSSTQVLVTRVGENLKKPKETGLTAPLYPIMQGGTEEELLFPPPSQLPESPPAPVIHHPGAKYRVGDPHKILATGKPYPRTDRQTRQLPSPYERPIPLMRKETNLINTGPFLLETYITGDPQMLSFQITLEI